MAQDSEDTNIVDIELHRGKAGLGFNIRGGTDIGHLKGHTGIFVTKIRDKGAAADDGRLQEGDQILEINGTDVTAVTHTTAVNLFLNAGNVVSLKVIPGEEERVKAKIAAEEIANVEKQLHNGQLESLKEEKGSSLVTVATILLGLAVVGGGAYLGYKYLKERS